MAGPPGHGPVIQLLEGTTIAQLCRPRQKIVLLEHNQSVGDALLTLSRHGILSAPLVLSPDIEEVQEGGQMSPQLLGWIDIADILRAFLDHMRARGQELPTKMLALMTLVEKEGPRFAERMLVTVQGAEDRSLVYSAEGGATSLMTAIRDLFLRQVAGETRVIHRIAVFEPHGEITHIISQTDIIKFLLAHVDELGPMANASLTELGLLTGKPPPVTVSPHIPTLTALERMLAERINGVPVVSEEGELIANLSISDLRNITPEMFGVLALPTAEFLAVEHGTAYLGYSQSSSSARHPFFAAGNRKSGPQKGDIALHTVKATTLLRELLHKLVDNHVHRVFVVDGDEHPRVQAVITLTDILRLVAGVW